ncbi:MAG: FAD binding domain-containing protein [Deltaproteobacteria bacterium]|nr:FAD binding domain-containing protein [Deltaproteobacteria bacterium]
MRLPSFEYLRPESLDAALEFLDRYQEDAALLAGGTDLLVRMKQRLHEPSVLISLKGIQGMNYVLQGEGVIKIGAMSPLASLLESETIRHLYPSLNRAVRLIGAPPIQHFRGTIGGNLCLETRCLYYDQSPLWRSGRTRCHKDKGETCYAEENSDRCRSANQSDGGCALMALGAMIELCSTKGSRILPIEEFFTGKGEKPFALDANEMVKEIRLTLPQEGESSSFHKLTYRSAIDFALVSAAAKVTVGDGKISSIRIAVGGAGAAPLLLKEAGDMLLGKSVSDTRAIEEASEAVSRHAAAFMVDNLGSSLEYRKKMAGVMARKAIGEALQRALEGMQ